MARGGFWGKILHADLTAQKSWTETVPRETSETLVGGRAMIAYLLLKHCSPGCDPLSAENILVFALGPLQGTTILGNGRHAVGGKSPLTGYIGASEAGGYFGTELKKCGVDALVVHGRADQPTYLSIRDDTVEFRSADGLWGQDTLRVEQEIKKELGEPKTRIAQCGIAGENLVRFASVMHDVNRAAGRNGLGAVMGSKRLKAVAVRGTRTVPVADTETVKQLTQFMAQNYRQMMGWVLDNGTSGAVLGMHTGGQLPTKNFSRSTFDDAAKIDGTVMARTIRQKRDTCFNCPARCKQVVGYTKGQELPPDSPFPDPEAVDFEIDPAYGGPEYESLGALGSNLMVASLLHVAKANELCARFGLDTISMGMTLAFAMECVEQKVLTDPEAIAALPEWGDGAKLLQAIELTATRKGFGDQLAEGSKRLAQTLGEGAQDLLVEVKGQEMAFHEPRAKFGHGLGVAVAPVGADHMMGMHDGGYTTTEGVAALRQFYPAEPRPTDVLDDEKTRIFYHSAALRHVFDCALLCMFYPYDWDQVSQALTAVTGTVYTNAGLLKVGERAQQLCRLFNNREGLTREQDRLPKRIMTAFTEGPLKGRQIKQSDLDNAISTWYRLMGWSAEGVPQKERLEELGLAELL